MKKLAAGLVSTLFCANLAFAATCEEMAVRREP
jgi:hypothetical protein